MAGGWREHTYILWPKNRILLVLEIFIWKNVKWGRFSFHIFGFFGGVEGNGYGGLCEMGKDYWRRVVPNEVVFHISGRHEWRPYENRIP